MPIYLWMLSMVVSDALAAEPVVVSLVPSPGAAVNGDALALRFTWINQSASPVRVPADLSALVSVVVDYRAPDEPVTGRGFGAGLTPTPAASLTWATVPPGLAQVQDVPLAQVAEVCAKGCPGGKYQIAVIPVRSVTGAASDQINPSYLAEGLSFELRTPTKTVGQPDIVLSWGERTVRLENPGSTSIWVPRPEHWVLRSCQWSRGKRSGGGVGGAVGGGAAWLTEAQLVELGPGEHLELPDECAPEEAWKNLHVELAPTAPIWLTGARPGARVWSGALVWDVAR